MSPVAPSTPKSPALTSTYSLAYTPTTEGNAVPHIVARKFWSALAPCSSLYTANPPDPLTTSAGPRHESSTDGNGNAARPFVVDAWRNGIPRVLVSAPTTRRVPAMYNTLGSTTYSDSEMIEADAAYRSNAAVEGYGEYFATVSTTVDASEPPAAKAPQGDARGSRLAGLS